jgi:uncharacterized protein involved in outer membrane biogenesis
MRWKWLLGICACLIVVLMAAVYVFLRAYDYNKLKPRIARMVKEATGRELNLGGDISLAVGFSPALVVTDITFANAPWASQPQMAKIDELQAQVRLLPLLVRNVELIRIGLKGVDVLLETNPVGQGNWEFSVAKIPAKKAGASKATKINVDNIRIEILKLRYRNEKTGSSTQFTLTDLKMSQPAADDKLAVDLRADYNGQPVTLSGNTGLISELLAHQRFPFKLSGMFSDATFNLQGAVEDLLKLRGIDLQARVSGKNLASLGLDRYIKLPQTSAYDVAGHLRGSKESLALSDLSGNLAGSNINLAISGKVGNLMSISDIDLQLKGSGKDLAQVGAIIDQKLPTSDDFTIEGQLTGSAKALTLKAAQGSARRGGLSIALEGGIKELIALNGLDVKVQASGKDLAELGAIIEQKLPATDQFSIQGLLTGSAKALSLKEAQSNAKRGSLRVALNGEVKDLIAFSGIDLKVKGSGKDLSVVGAIIGEKLPVTDEFAVEGRLTGSAKALSLHAAQGSARRGSMDLKLDGGINDLNYLKGIDLKVKASGRDLAQIGTIIDQKLPTTDQFTVQARLIGSKKALSLQSAQGSARRGSLSIALDGTIKDLIGISGMDLKLKGSGKDLAEVGAIIGQKLPTTDEFTIEAWLTGSAKSFSLQHAQGSANRGNLNLTLNGGIEALPALEGINFMFKASGKELAEIGPLVGTKLPELGPFNVSGKLAGSAQAIALNGFSAIVDKSDFNGLARLQFFKRPKITVRLESSVIDFTALMKSLEKDSQKPAKNDKQKRRLFSDDPLPFDVLKKVDADIVLKAKNIHAKDAHLEFGHMTLKLEDQDFSIERLEATYKTTKIGGNLYINVSSSPQVATNFLVQSFNLGDFLKETGKSDQARAIVDIAAHGKSRGNSVNRLMANLNGEFGAVMGPGFLSKYLDLLSVDLSQKVIPIWGSHKKAGEINCAVVQFDIKNGVAASQAFVFDSQIGILDGEGDISLGTEQINFLLVPKPKNPGLLSLSTKLRVSGTLMDPNVRPDLVSLVTKGAKFLSTLAVGPIGLLAPFVHLGAHKKHPCDIQGIGQLGLKIPASK